ncbi:MAG: hypothetical protein DRI86_12155, partial [Bacteroidetes bacterium]
KIDNVWYVYTPIDQFNYCRKNYGWRKSTPYPAVIKQLADAKPNYYYASAGMKNRNVRADLGSTTTNNNEAALAKFNKGIEDYNKASLNINNQPVRINSNARQGRCSGNRTRNTTTTTTRRGNTTTTTTRTNFTPY